jgi:AraC-like DNA-binding protein
MIRRTRSNPGSSRVLKRYGCVCCLHARRGPRPVAEKLKELSRLERINQGAACRNVCRATTGRNGMEGWGSCFTLEARSLSATRRDEMSKRLERIKDWKELAVDCGFQLEVMAKRCGVSERTLRRHFQRQFSINPKTWVDRKRAGIAAEHLRNGDSVKTTAADLQFTQRSQFSKFFKRVSGTAPGHYAQRS